MFKTNKKLLLFWAVALAGIGAGAAYLQYLGPPQIATTEIAVPPPAKLATRPQAPAAPDEMVVRGGVGTKSALASGAPIPLPSADLLASSPINPQWQVPRIGPDGTTPMQLYAASTAPPANVPLLPPGVPRIAIIVAGLGDDAQTGLYSATGLPPEISLAIYPVGHAVSDIAAAARANGHETLLVLPMPMLLVRAPAPQNQTTLDWSMAQLQGFAGVTDAFGPAMGGGFTADAGAKAWLMTNLARKGLFYIEGDPAAPAAPYAAGRNADVVMDATADGPGLSAKLAALVADAREQNSALGLMLNPTPDALRTLADWSRELVNQDIMLVPVSALVLPPEVPLPVTTAANNKP